MLHQHVKLDTVPMQKPCNTGLPQLSFGDLIDVNRLEAREAFEEFRGWSIAAEKELVGRVFFSACQPRQKIRDERIFTAGFSRRASGDLDSDAH
jgi:hypothetical protein